MPRCEDFPACGHELGCCPDFDESGRQLNMVCVCGAKVPVNNRSSLCDSCLRRPDPDDYPLEYQEYIASQYPGDEEDEEDESD